MIESEARTKWCPFAHSRGVSIVTDAPAPNTKTISYGVFHREDGEGINIQCIGSKCMAWRATDNVYLPEPQTTSVIKESVPAGYCGLAGKDG